MGITGHWTKPLSASLWKCPWHVEEHPRSWPGYGGVSDRQKLSQVWLHAEIHPACRVLLPAEASPQPTTWSPVLCPQHYKEVHLIGESLLSKTQSSFLKPNLFCDQQGETKIILELLIGWDDLNCSGWGRLSVKFSAIPLHTSACLGHTNIFLAQNKESSSQSISRPAALWSNGMGFYLRIANEVMFLLSLSDKAFCWFLGWPANHMTDIWLWDRKWNKVPITPSGERGTVTIKPFSQWLNSL